MFRGEIERPFHVLVDRRFSFVGERNDHVQEAEVTRLLHPLTDRRDNPESIIGTRVFESVDDIGRAWSRDDGGEPHARERVLLWLEDFRVEQVQPVSETHLSMQQFDNPLAALLRVRVHHRHHVLRGISVPQACSPSHFNK